MLHKSSGIFRYSWHDDVGFKLIVEVEPDIARFYRKLVPKFVYFNSQLYDPHISVVRKEKTVNMDFWGKYEGESVDFYYETHMRSNETYFWLDVWSVRLEEIRLELGLSIIEEFTTPAEGFRKAFHITLGNFKKN